LGTRSGLIMQTIAIPRGQVVLAGGTAKPDDERISVEARRGDTRFGICSTAFLEAAFRTDYYRIDITFNPTTPWTYVSRTDLCDPRQDRGVRPPGHNHYVAGGSRRRRPNPAVWSVLRSGPGRLAGAHAVRHVVRRPSGRRLIAGRN
jgi:hypothetical protein